jgi:hypothetical protein
MTLDPNNLTFSAKIKGNAKEDYIQSNFIIAAGWANRFFQGLIDWGVIEAQIQRACQLNTKNQNHPSNGWYSEYGIIMMSCRKA